MKSIILDTNVISELMRSQPEQTVMDWFLQLTGSVFYVSVITQAEIMLGISLLPSGKRRDTLAAVAEGMFTHDFAGRCLPFESTCVPCYAAVVANRRRAGQTISTEDAMIAAISLSHGYSLATRNTKDFMHIDGLELYNPWQASPK